MQINLKNAQSGMILKNEVSISNGKIVFKRGQILTTEIILTLEINSITSIEIDNQQVHSVPLPEIIISINNDCFSARLIVEPKGNPDEMISVEILKEHLRGAGVNRGIDEKALQNIVSKWCKNKRRYEIEYVAIGKHPEPAKEGSLRMRVKSIGSHNELDRVKKATLYRQVEDIALHCQKVSPGTIIGEKEVEKPLIPGYDVKGRLIFTDEVIKSFTKIDQGAVFSKDNKQVLSTITGFAYFIDDVAGVVEVNFDGAAEVVLSADRMSATMVIHAPGEGGKMPDENELNELLEKNKISFGIHYEILKKTIFGFTNGEYPKEPLLIAEGVQPCNGENGKIEFLFNVETSLKPKENPDGSVDYKNVDIINSVNKGVPLVKLIPPTKGTPGINICGESVNCKEGVAAKLPIGSNTEVLLSDSSILISSIDGVICYNGSVVDVSEGFIVKGDVNFSTGHIKYDKSVVVSGDVKGGFNVNCGGDLQIDGVIEDCHISAAGNLLCKSGFVGQGKGIIESKGNVNLGFMKNQTVKSKMDVNIAHEALNCLIYARRRIVIHGNPLSVAGGTLIARDAIILNSVGNHSGIRTTLEVGIDYTFVDELEKTETSLNELKANYAKLNESYVKYSKIASVKGKSSAQERSIMDKLVQSITKYREQINAMESRKKLIQKNMYYLDNACIKIHRSAFPGTLFKFGERNYLIKDELIGPKMIKLIDHEIEIL